MEGYTSSSRCLATGEGLHRDTYNLKEGLSSGAMMYISSFIKIGSDIPKLIKDDSQTQGRNGDLIKSIFIS
jgi:hypothetical protein